jgi:hypothetical protein
MTDTPSMGPVALCTLVAVDGQALVDAYTTWLHQEVAACGQLDSDTATAIGMPQLAGNRNWILANTQGRAWLQIVEHPAATARDALQTYGWLALEILVEDVDQLAASLTDSPFTTLRPVADLDISDKIRACQVRGPAGEILYLTQVKGEVPPFDLPVCEAPVDHLFIPVLSTPSREQSLQQYSTISGNDGIGFDTKITVVNQARGFDLDLRHPVATLQLAGQTLIEIDQITGTIDADNGIASGMACVAFHCSGSPGEEAVIAENGPFSGHPVTNRTGCAGEKFTLVYS